jgi:coproporphyrinogen III oxidase-like Fe-S oxidoreductase
MQDSPIAAREELTQLDDRMLFFDAVIFGLRMNRGIDWCELQRRFPSAGPLDSLEALLQQFVGEGLVRCQAQQYTLSPKGRLLADGIGSACLELIA